MYSNTNTYSKKSTNTKYLTNTVLPESSESLTMFVRTAVVCSSESPTALKVSNRPRATICLKNTKITKVQIIYMI